MEIDANGSILMIATKPRNIERINPHAKEISLKNSKTKGEEFRQKKGLASREVISERTEICLACHSRRSGICKLTGLPWHGMAGMERRGCPEGKWNPILGPSPVPDKPKSAKDKIS
jgi:hypothetical protein